MPSATGFFPKVFAINIGACLNKDINYIYMTLNNCQVQWCPD